MAVTNDRIQPPSNVQNRRLKQTFDTYAYTIDLVPLVLEKTCFAGHIHEIHGNYGQSAQTRKRKADPKVKKQAKAHPPDSSEPQTTKGAILVQPAAHLAKAVVR